MNSRSYLDGPLPDVGPPGSPNYDHQSSMNPSMHGLVNGNEMGNLGLYGGVGQTVTASGHVTGHGSVGQSSLSSGQMSLSTHAQMNHGGGTTGSMINHNAHLDKFDYASQVAAAAHLN